MADVIRVNEGTYRIEDDGVRFFLLEGKDKALLIDSGMNTPNAKEIAESITSLPLELLNTHADRDHISGNNAFEKFYMSANELGNYEKNEDSDAKRVIPVKDGDCIDLGERELYIYDNPGHTPGSIVILDKKNRVLIGGDAIQDGNIFMFGQYRNINDYVVSLRKINAMKDEFDTIYPSHGTFPVYPDIIEKLISGAECIIAGQAVGEDTQIFDNKVCLYKFDYAGFLCEPKK